MEANLPLDLPWHHSFPRSQQKTALLILGAQKSFIRKRCNQRVQYPAYSQPDSVTKRFPRHSDSWINIFGQTQEFHPQLLPSTAPHCKRGFKHSSTHGGGGKWGHSFIHLFIYSFIFKHLEISKGMLGPQRWTGWDCDLMVFSEKCWKRKCTRPPHYVCCAPMECSSRRAQKGWTSGGSGRQMRLFI